MRWGLLISVLAGLLWTAQARAGTYDVYGCRLLDGRAIPADGWTPMVNFTGTSAQNRCAYLHGLTATLANEEVQRGALAGWVFDAPPDTSISYYSLRRSSHVTSSGAMGGGRDSWLFHDAPVTDLDQLRYVQSGCAWLARCTGSGDPGQTLAAVNREERVGLEIRRLIYAIRCDAATVCAPAEGAGVTIWSSRFGLSDPYAPVFTQPPHGSLLSTTGPIDGERSVAFRAEDHGGGIASVAFAVDGHLYAEQPADATVATCAQPYTVRVPCPLKIDKAIALDTEPLSNGPHQIQVAVTDVAGNRTLSEPTTVEVRNGGAPNGARASRFARLEAWFDSDAEVHRTAVVVRYGGRRALIGRLVDEHGSPISGASLEVTAESNRPGSQPAEIGEVVTDGNGGFAMTPPPGESRILSFNYRAFTLDSAPTASTHLLLQARAGITLSVSPRRVGPRGTIRFSGRLLGGPGRAGTQVVLYALGGGRSRIPVTTVRADRTGRFHYRYRFRSSSPGISYRFQARMHSQRDYPYATGTSGTVTVRIVKSG